MGASNSIVYAVLNCFLYTHTYTKSRQAYANNKKKEKKSRTDIHQKCSFQNLNLTSLDDESEAACRISLAAEFGPQK